MKDVGFSRNDLCFSLLLGLAGGLIGFGHYQTLPGAALGAGIGLIVLPVMYICVHLF